MVNHIKKLLNMKINILKLFLLLVVGSAMLTACDSATELTPKYTRIT